MRALPVFAFKPLVSEAEGEGLGLGLQPDRHKPWDRVDRGGGGMEHGPHLLCLVLLSPGVSLVLREGWAQLKKMHRPLADHPEEGAAPVNIQAELAKH